MTSSYKTDSLRGVLLTAAASIVLAACGGSSSETDAAKPAAPAQSAAANPYITATDHKTGNVDAAVTVVEYASIVCGHCANWHSTVYPDFKKKYIDTGKVLYVFRPFPTSPQELADAGHLIAECAAEEKYFDNINLQFERQKQIFEMAGKGQAREAYISVAKSAGLSEEEFLACMTDEETRAAYKAVVEGGLDAGVTGTPSFFINGNKEKVYKLEEIEQVILPLLGEPLPEATEPEAKE